jgi:large subunit ribosomal protein L32
MAEPKKKISKANTRSRRHQIRLKKPAIAYCEKCHQPKLRHLVCMNCGTYKGKSVLVGPQKIAEGEK